MSLEDLFARSQVWRGLQGGSSPAALATGFDELDRYLPGGGWPQKAVTEIFLERYGIGELRLLMPALARLGQRTFDVPRWIVWIAPPFIPYAPALRHFGIDLDRVLLVHPTGAERNALWAVEQALCSGASDAVLAWVGDASHTVLRRLQLAAEAHACWAVLFRPRAALRHSSPAALRFKLSRAGERLRVEIIKCRGARPGIIELELPSNGPRKPRRSGGVE